jgi:hypothetical protein
MFSTRLHPLRVATQDAIMAAGAGLAAQALLRYVDYLAHGHYWQFETIDLVMFTAVPAVLAAMGGLFGSLIARHYPYLRRSMRRTVCGTALAILLPPLLAYCMPSFDYLVLDFYSWAAVTGWIGAGTANLGFRVLGFYAPRPAVRDDQTTTASPL